MSWELAGRPLQRILVTRLRYLGDIAMSTVVLAALRRGDPAVELGYLCEEGFGPLLADHPDLQSLHLLHTGRQGADARARVQPAVGDGRAAPGAVGTALDLRRQHYDLAVDLFFNPRSAWLLRFSGVPWRIGGTAGSRRHLYTHVAPAPPPGARADFARIAPGGLGDHLARLAPLRHQPTGLAFLDWLPTAFAPGQLRPRVAAPAPAGTPVAPLLASLGAGTRGYTLLAPGATWPTKEWPAPHWRELAGTLADTSDGAVVILGPPGGDPHDALASAVPAGRGGLLPPLSLADALRVVAGARRVISADGGIMHAAVAMGVPTLALFGPTDPAIWFPYEGLGPFRVLATRPPCAPCHRHHCDAFICLPDLRPEVVLAAAAELPGRGEPS
jgi:ADP-heptose:LPS heptosyltransferase